MSASVIVNDAPLVHACWNDEALDINNDNAGKNEHCFFLCFGCVVAAGQPTESQGPFSASTGGQGMATLQL
jgi:hypothetical protein